MREEGKKRKDRQGAKAERNENRGKVSMDRDIKRSVTSLPAGMFTNAPSASFSEHFNLT